MSKVGFLSFLVLGGACSVFGAGAQSPATVSGPAVGHNTPKFAAIAKNMGPEDSSKVIDVSIWLNVHNRGELDTLATQLYDRNSPNYRHWLDQAEFVSRFAPTAAEAKTVQDFFTTHNLHVVAVEPHNFFVRAQGTVAAVKSAFHVAIDKFDVNGTTYRGNTSDPYIDGPAGALMGAVYGLDNLQFKHPVIVQPKGTFKATSPGGVQKAAAGTGPGAGAVPPFFTSNCFGGAATQTFTTLGSFPIGTYKGNVYSPTGNVSGCGYTPAEIHTAYNLNSLYKEGYDGTGQTIVILDWCGSPTVTQDANAFSAKFGLPALDSSNFRIIPYPSRSTCASPDAEINLDVEWAHAIAPGAAIDLVVPPTGSFDDVDSAYLFAVTEGLGNVISGSYGSPELFTPVSVLVTENFIGEAAAVLGIAANFSTGDDGDFTFDLNDPIDFPATVSAPADSPWVTAVGGVTLALNSNNTIKFQTGWGNNQTLLDDEGFIFDPPANLGFQFGSGGGPSALFTKPHYQAHLHGTTRQLPDISWLGDPYTSAVIAITEPGVFPPLQYEAIGGTSLSCPMFSALWAIANQEAGFPLGQAAPYLYSMPASTITDIVPFTSATNVTAKIQESGILTNSYSAADLAQPLEGTTKFYSALWNPPLFDETAVVITFGTDSGLKTAVGWDNVTGLGTPNGKAFADYFKIGGGI